MDTEHPVVQLVLNAMTAFMFGYLIVGPLITHFFLK